MTKCDVMIFITYLLFNLKASFFKYIINTTWQESKTDGSYSLSTPIALYGLPVLLPSILVYSKTMMQLRQSAFACILSVYLRSTVRESKAASAVRRRIHTQKSPDSSLPTFVTKKSLTRKFRKRLLDSNGNSKLAEPYYILHGIKKTSDVDSFRKRVLPAGHV